MMMIRFARIIFIGCLLSIVFPCFGFTPSFHSTTTKIRHSSSQCANAAVVVALRASFGDDDDQQEAAFARNVARTDLRRFLTQRAIQSFMFLLQSCRDPHTVTWMEKFGGVNNMLEFHGTGAFDIERFPSWESFLLELLEQPKETIVIKARRRGGGRGGWSKNNPYLKDRFVEFYVDIDPISLSSRLLSVREQVAQEWVDDLDTVVVANEEILNSYFDKQMDQRDQEEREGELEDNDTKNDNISGIASDSSGIMDLSSMGTTTTTTTGGGEEKKDAYDRMAMRYLLNKSAFEDSRSSPFRKGNFDLLILLLTQESIHRVLREFRQAGETKEVSFDFLRDFYIDRVADYFDGPQPYNRADDFLESLLLTPPSVKQTGRDMVGLVDPLGIAQEIIRMRTRVAREWRDIVLNNVPAEHMDVRKAILASQMQTTKPEPPPAAANHIEIIQGGDFE